MSREEPEAAELEALTVALIRAAPAAAGLTPYAPPPPLPGAGALRALARGRIDSIAYLIAAPDHKVQRLYDRLWQAQRDEVRDVLARIGEAGVEVLPIQGLEKVERYFGARALGRRSDLDFLVRPDDIPTLRQLLVGSGYEQATIDREGGLHPITEKEQEAILQATKVDYDRPFPFLKCLDPALEAELAAIVPSTLRPLRRVGDGFELVIALDLLIRYDPSIPVDLAWQNLRPSAFAGTRTLSAEQDLLYTAYRLVHCLERLDDSVPLARLLAEMAIVTAAEPVDWAEMAAFADAAAISTEVWLGLAMLVEILGDDGLASQLARIPPAPPEARRRGDALASRLFPVSWGSRISERRA